jgi:hypothetical protein
MFSDKRRQKMIKLRLYTMQIYMIRSEYAKLEALQALVDREAVSRGGESAVGTCKY